MGCRQSIPVEHGRSAKKQESVAELPESNLALVSKCTLPLDLAENLGNRAKNPCDPFSVLNDDLMLYIFAFVGPVSSALEGHNNKKTDTDPTTSSAPLPVTDAANFYYSLAAVSQAWKGIMDNSIGFLAPSIEVDLVREFLLERRIPWLPSNKGDLLELLVDIPFWNYKENTKPLEFLFRHKLSVTYIRTPHLPLHDGILAQVLRYCDVSKLRGISWAFTCKVSESAWDAHNHFQDLLKQACPGIRSISVWTVTKTRLLDSIVIERKVESQGYFSPTFTQAVESVTQRIIGPGQIIGLAESSIRSRWFPFQAAMVDFSVQPFRSSN